MAFKMKYKNLQEVVSGLETASKMHAKQAKVVKGHIEEMEKGSTPTKMADLNKAGEITKADVLIGRGVIDPPTKKTLKPCQKAAAKAKFDVYPSAYANMWASKHKC